MILPREQFARLSPERRRLLRRVLQDRDLDPASFPILPRAAEDDPAPLSHAQERLWVLDRLEPGSAYNEVYSADLGPELHPPDLAAALAELKRRHEALRTTFEEVEAGPVQRVGPPPPARLPQADLSALPRAAAVRVAARLERVEARRPFDLRSGPLLRALLLRLADGSFRLLLGFHHIVCDAPSLRIVAAEVGELLAAARERRPARLAELPVQPADFAVWQREWLGDAWFEARLAGRLERLAGAPVVLDLPTDRPRAPERAGRGGRVAWALEPAHVGRLAELGQDVGATPFMVVLAAFALVLRRFGGQRELLVGTPAARRVRPELEGVVGFFVDTLVVRCDLGADPSFAELLERVRAATLDAFGDPDVPFSRLVDKLVPVRSPGVPPLVQVVVLLQRRGGRTAVESPGDARWGLPLRRLDSGGAKFDLTLVVDAGEGDLAGEIEYDADLFDAATVGRLAGGLAELLAAAAGEAGEPLSRLSSVTQGERRQLLAAGAGADLPERSEEAGLVARVAARAAADPEAPAVVAVGGAVWSYGRLMGEARRLAHRLRRAGVGPEDRVGLLMDRSPATVAAILGVLEAGGAYVPLDRDYPPARLAQMLDDARPVVTLTTPGLADRLPEGAGAVLVLGPDLAEVTGESPEPLAPVAVGVDRLAYVIFTSGSTGRPKGVTVSHRSAVNLTRSFIAAWSLGPGERLLMVPSLAFDASVGDLFPALSSGAALVLHPDPGSLSAEELSRVCEEAGATLVDIPAALWRGWLAGLEAGAPPPPACLRLVVAGGESVAAEQVAAWHRATGGRVAFFGPYGPTEATVATTGLLALPDGKALGRPGRLPIGRPLPGTRVYLLDPLDRGALAPLGARGEIAIGGAGVVRGYLRRPAETADRFRPDPFSAEPGGRLYRTGDLARWLPGGDLLFLGRRDHQVKVRGFRIELGEVEAALAGHPGVAACAVLARERDAGPVRLVAYVAAKTGRSPEVASLRAHAEERLPPFAVPAAWVVLDRLPVTAGGKLDRAALPDPEAAPRPASRLPQNPVERLLARLWQEVLRCGPVGLDDNFFELGGDSILSIQVASRAGREGLRLTPRQVFRHPTVASLAAAAGAAAPARVAPDAEEAAGTLPPSPIQRWFFSAVPVHPEHWNQALLLAVDRRFEPGVWERAFARLVDHHDALRLRARHADGGWSLEIAGAEASRPCSRIDLCAVAPDRRRTVLEAVAGALQASLGLGSGPIFRAAVFDLGAGHGERLLWTVHHLAVDGVSWRILLEDLEALLRAAGSGREPELPPKSTPYRHWARRLAERAQEPEVLGEVGFWTRQASGARLPCDHDLGPNTVASAAEVRGALDAETTRRLLTEVATTARAEVVDALLAALLLAWERRTGARELLVELEAHGRESELFAGVDLTRTVGWFTSAYPLRLELGAASGAGGALRAVKERRRAVPGRGLGWGLLRWGRSEAALPDSGAELAFNYLGRFDRPAHGLLSPAAEGAGPERSPAGLRCHLIEFNASVSGDRLHHAWTYSRNRHRADSIERLAAAFAAALAEVVEHCGRPDAVGWSPSDFRRSRVSQADLDRLAARLAGAGG